jgi:hypothetical protein
MVDELSSVHNGRSGVPCRRGFVKLKKLEQPQGPDLRDSSFGLLELGGLEPVTGFPGMCLLGRLLRQLEGKYSPGSRPITVDGQPAA